MMYLIHNNLHCILVDKCIDSLLQWNQFDKWHYSDKDCFDSNSDNEKTKTSFAFL